MTAAGLLHSGVLDKVRDITCAITGALIFPWATRVSTLPFPLMLCCILRTPGVQPKNLRGSDALICSSVGYEYYELDTRLIQKDQLLEHSTMRYILHQHQGQVGGEKDIDRAMTYLPGSCPQKSTEEFAQIQGQM